MKLERGLFGVDKDDYRRGNGGQEGNKDMKYAKYNDSMQQTRKPIIFAL